MTTIGWMFPSYTIRSIFVECLFVFKCSDSNCYNDVLLHTSPNCNTDCDDHEYPGTTKVCFIISVLD
jgi:hypothetical protein